MVLPPAGTVATGRGDRRALVALAVQALAHHLAMAAHRLRLLARLALGRLLVVSAQLHLAKDPLALHLLLERAQGLVDIVVADKNLHVGRLSSQDANNRPGAPTCILARRKSRLA